MKEENPNLVSPMFALKALAAVEEKKIVIRKNNSYI
jgi:hypothetical protein